MSATFFYFDEFRGRVAKNIYERGVKLVLEQYGETIAAVEANFQDMSRWNVAGDVFIANLKEFPPEDKAAVLKIVQFLIEKYRPVQFECHDCIGSPNIAIVATIPCVVTTDQSKK